METGEKKSGIERQVRRECLSSRNCLAFAAFWVSIFTFSYSSFRIAVEEKKLGCQKIRVQMKQQETQSQKKFKNPILED